MFGKNEIVGQKFFSEVTDDKMFVTSMFMTLQGEGPYRGQPAFFIRLAKCNLNCSFCFVGSTKITMESGVVKAIKDIKEGERVVAYDEKTNKFVFSVVTKKYQSQTDVLFCVKTKTKKTYVTPEHPFLVKDKGWVEAKNLESNDVILHLDLSNNMQLRNPSKLESVKLKRKENLTLDQRVKYSNRMKKTFNEHPTMRADLIERMTTNNPMKDPAIAIKGLQTTGKWKRKTGVEKRFEIMTAGLPIKYIGDGSVIIGNKSPDFIVQGQKKVIEVWASDAQHASIRDENWMKNRAEIFAKEGYETLFVPIAPNKKKQGQEEQIRKNVAQFISNGEIVQSISTIQKPDKDSSYSEINRWVRLAGNKLNDCTVYNLEVENQHTYIANGMIVHNCDTFFDDGDWLTFDEIDQKIDETIEQFYITKGTSVPVWAKLRKMVLVMTGGEPMLQKKIGKFLETIGSTFKNTQIESNGTIVQDIPKSTTLVVSPKCSEKNGVSVKYLSPKPEMLARADCLKFVMSADQNSPYHAIPEWAYVWHETTGRQIFVSPMNIYNDITALQKTRRSEEDISLEARSTKDEVVSFWEPGLLNMEQNQKNHEYTAQFCIEHGFIFNMQLHLFASLA